MNFISLGKHVGNAGSLPETPQQSPPVILPRYVQSALSPRKRRFLFIALGFVAFFYGFYFALGTTFVLLPLSVPLITMAVVIVWLLPDTGRAPTKLLNQLLLAFFIAMICWPNYLALALPGMPWITAIRLVVTPMAAVFLVCLSVSSNFRKQLLEIIELTPVIWKLLATFVTIQLISIVFSRKPSISTDKFVVAQLYWTLIFFTSCYAFTIPGNARRLASLMWYAALFVALIGLWEWRLQRLPWAGHIPSFLRVDDELLAGLMKGSARAATGLYRVKSVFTTPLGLGEYLAFATPFVLHAILTRQNYAVKLAGVATIVLIFAILLRADTRLGMVGFLLSFLLTLLAWGALRWRENRHNLWAQGLVLLYPVLFSAFIASTFFVRRLAVLVWGSGAQQASTDARKVQFAMGLPKVFKEPWGHGIGQAADTLGYYSSGTLTIDTYYLSIALEYGVIGFFVFFGMFAYAIYVGARTLIRCRDSEVQLLAPICLALVNFIVVKSVFSQEANHPLVFGLLGAVVALAYRARQIGASVQEPASNIAAIRVRDQKPAVSKEWT